MDNAGQNDARYVGNDEGEGEVGDHLPENMERNQHANGVACPDVQRERLSSVK